jgi:DNA-binding GntR family transcriptional regulator
MTPGAKDPALLDFKVLAPPSLTESVAAELRSGITTGRLEPGERLVEADLAARMGISRAPVREALRQLEYEGLVTGRPRRGYVVRELSADELLEIYDLRVLLEPVLAAAAAERFTPEKLAELGDIVDRMRDGARCNDSPIVVQADRDFHAQIGRFSGRPLTAQIFDHFNAQVRRFTQAMVVTYADIGQMVDEHQSLLDALASGDPQRAAAEMRLHLEDARRRLTLVLGESAGAAADHPRPDGRGVATDRVAAPEVIAAGTIRSAQ